MNLPFSPALLKKSMSVTFPSLDFDQVGEQVLSLSMQLMENQSITPDDQGCQTIIRKRLTQLGFAIEDMSRNGITNTWASRGKSGPMLVLAGHTDVVMPGPLALWHSNPFTPQIREGHLFGRGAADMKTGLAALIIAAERFVQNNPDHKGKLAFAITSDEEGIAADGTQAIIDTLNERQLVPDWCLVGEPSSKDKVGDAIRIGRRGSLIARLKLNGKQGHVAYSHAVVNPVHKIQKLVNKLVNKQWDFPSRYFPATSCQITKFEANSGANNLTPATANLTFNFRYSPKQTAEKLQKYIENKLAKLHIEYELEWFHEAKPYFCRRSPLLTTVQKVVSEINGTPPELSTAGGTSDGRFFAEMGTHVVELGVSNKTIHQCNESVNLNDLTKLVFMYERVLQRLLG